MLDILILFNNYFHDLTSALWLITALTMWFLDREAAQLGRSQLFRLYIGVFPKLIRVSLVSIGFNLIFGLVRAVNYMEFEYLPAAGQGQIMALVIKHIILFGTVLAGIIIQVKVYKRYRKNIREEHTIKCE